MASRDYTLEHTKPIFNKHCLLTLHNLYVLRILTESIKIIKHHLPIPMFKSLVFCPQSHHFRLLIPKFDLDISRHNFVISASKLWNSCIDSLLDNAVLSTIKSLPGMKCDSQIVIPGSNSNSDMTIPISIFKNRLRAMLLQKQKLGTADEWEDNMNFIRP